MQRRKFVQGSAALGATALASMTAMPAFAQAKPVRVALGWINNVEYAGIWMAQEMGYFKEEDLDGDINGARKLLAPIYAWFTRRSGYA